ncbi:GntR family transcriptional regulator [Sinorhizobium meliloti]|uniref:GntR family transcriptional regulator n=1 Tax=Rhizobium meliloti TaxID=382 RepID=UPI0004829BBC|nr:GntR family transcriptional regulator [Sinorhizobium meliloti]MCM5687834.1 GntR family transcriptional regulator [Sinorhizobium meliloti]MDE4615929.1 GntR family transcriptional regulator [Sinorhizobium meliloti]RVK92356.1 GntR family transcriptional regulator [Sinorhizobium meliloti]RVM17927.1 GntR family transcriptional regulator [Sinorhizobium meliloti]RVN44899.1 GntR family transcriptional regulator [Sinorhizobium meliloti]
MFSHHEYKLGWGRSKANQAYKALKKLVVYCEVPPCTRLDAITISNVLDTSITPVREALIQLETEKYIVSCGNGYYTQKLEVKKLADHFDFIKMVLTHAFRENLYEHSKFVMLPSWDDYYLISEFLESFCESVAEATKNDRMRHCVHESNIRTRYVRWLDLQRPERLSRLSRIRGDASELLELLDRGDKDGAIANVDRQFSAVINTIPELVLEGNDRAGNTKESWLQTLSSNWAES